MGWNGRFLEDFAVGDVYEHPLGRTVLAVDNSWFTLLMQVVITFKRTLLVYRREHAPSRSRSRPEVR